MTTFVKEFTDPAIIKWKWRTEMVQQYYCDALVSFKVLPV